ncbi:2-oxoglutarate dehydrogenase E1 component [Temperatibacter marinus]|uniref:2-oxoglutarate dehydrogenase E1 component n=1 Tax=Temperatibacter marinus TaxID=1456591 RepID=A0AA52H8N3_9PROT|nr:2-oxoglutarate dehydrogenase E1 component [Temperatibacter marinus]WND01642.1 2-oxoglutarate dehydrogenase E1 component [Temperatibacter marinus]
MGADLDNIARLEGVSPAFVEGLYDRYIVNPDSVDAGWRSYFEALESGIERADDMQPSWARKDWPLRPDDDLTTGLDATDMFIEGGKKPATGGGVSAEEVRAATLDSIRALMMVRTYRVRGHLMANLDPLGLEERAAHPELDPQTYGFSDADMDRPIFMDNVLGLETSTVREIVAILKRTYCGNLGVEFMHINDPEEKSWIQRNIEGRDKEIQFTDRGKVAILSKIIEAEQFEKFLGKKYTGTKRFGLDGGESLVPALEAIMKTGGQHEMSEIVLGMPHRGRLNVLANVMAKPYRAMFNEFAGGASKPDDVQGSGDVKYHLGTSADRDFDGNNIHLSLTANPSHLEAVNPVVLGKVRAKQDQKNDATRRKVCPVLLHGDAAFAGQGIVPESLAMSGLDGYNAGGCIHFIVNNQIGFTTSPQFSRSSPYPSDVAKMVQAPIFHVNGDDPEAVTFATKLATEFRQTFKRDVVIDMFCYRRFGHNESDEPSFTQPLMYASIKKHPSVGTIFSDRLIKQGVITAEQYQQMVNEFTSHLEAEFEAGKSYKVNEADWFQGQWEGLATAKTDPEMRRADSGVDDETLREVGEVLTTLPENFHPHRTLTRILKNKEHMFEFGDRFDWSTAEALAFGTLLKEGYGVRLSGQDCGRGTFSQRHAVFVDQKTEHKYRPLKHVNEDAHFEVLDSPLSEFGVLGFEYGYTLAEPKTLTLWEAQFGDFANGAQIMIDQFISSGEAKWLRMSGLVMLLPHGYEGQGPEHSSARFERFLQMSAEDNWQVANCTTPANYFHILRRQMHREFRKPLIMMTPKSLLRHKLCTSTLADFGPGSQFHRVLWDDAEHGSASELKLAADDKIKRVVLCTGKVYFDLLEERDKREQSDTYLMRVEQLYPFPADVLTKELARFKNVESIMWCQEEPKNMGAWSFVDPFIEDVLTSLEIKPNRASYAGRAASAATATGQASVHARQQAALIDEALKG